jgi:ATP/maltotriose-dependent transcriptional regulator MalT
VSEVLARCEALLEQVSGDRKAEAVIDGALAQLHAMQGRFDRARELYRRGAEMLHDLGPSVTASSWSIESSRVEMLAGDPAAAVRELRRDHDALEGLGERYFRSTIAALLAQALVALQENAEGVRFARIAHELADDDDTLTQVLWRSALAIVRAREGADDEAEALAREAIALAAATVDLDLQADAHVDCAEVLGIAGRRDESGPLLREALDRYERKEDLVSAERVRAALTEVGAA